MGVVGVVDVVVAAAKTKTIFPSHHFGQHSAVLVTDDDGQQLYSWNANKLLVPASTIKIATSIAAIEKFGLNYRFKTDFFVVDDVLWVKGYGDPYLTSEELDVVAIKLIQLLTELRININSVIVDGTYFPTLSVPGRNFSAQPYDAPLAAVSANFNTIKVRKLGADITSGESQTPITPLAKKLARQLVDGMHRINLIKTNNSEQYFAELLAAKLNEHGYKRFIKAETGLLPIDARLFYQHINSHSLEDALRAMMFYSNNFIANQLFLQMRDETMPIGFQSSQKYVYDVLGNELDINADGSMQARIVEGSGLSRSNALTAEHLIVLLDRFKPHRKLMRSYLDGNVYAKSGTLNNVHNLVGYLTKNGKNYYFVFLFNEKVPWRYKDTLLKDLYATL